MKGITDADYMHAKRICKDFEIKNLEEYYDLYVSKQYIILRWCIKDFVCLKNMCLNISELLPAEFLSCSELAWHAALKKTKVKLDLLSNINVIIVETSIRVRICHSIYWYAKANNKYMKEYYKNRIFISSVLACK